MPNVLIAGATGQVGSAVLRRGVKVVRDRVNSRYIATTRATRGDGEELRSFLLISTRANSTRKVPWRSMRARVVLNLVLDDGTTIGEVPAIMRYLAEAFPETPLLGASSG